jgi:hypothetical protein
MQTTIYIRKENEKFWNKLENKSHAINKWLSVVSGDSSAVTQHNTRDATVTIGNPDQTLNVISIPKKDLKKSASIKPDIQEAPRTAIVSSVAPKTRHKPKGVVGHLYGIEINPDQDITVPTNKHVFPPSVASQL